jgi:hypothetical protein
MSAIPTKFDALDAAQARNLAYKHVQAKRHDGNRGVAVLGDRVFFVSSDAHCWRCMRRPALLWDKEYGGHEQNSQIHATPGAAGH